MSLKNICKISSSPTIKIELFYNAARHLFSKSHFLYYSIDLHNYLWLRRQEVLLWVREGISFVFLNFFRCTERQFFFLLGIVCIQWLNWYLHHKCIINSSFSDLLAYYSILHFLLIILCATFVMFISFKIKSSKAFLKVWERQHTKSTFLPASINFTASRYFYIGMYINTYWWYGWRGINIPL